MAKKLSARQQAILNFIGDYLDEHQYPPTIRDIQHGCDISSTSVVDYNLQILQREGHLRRQSEVSRGIELLDGVARGSRRDILRVPIMGNIAAGEPLSMPDADARYSEDLDSIDLPSSITGGKNEVYGLRVKGSSMIDALVADGDLVLLEAVNQPTTATWWPPGWTTWRRRPSSDSTWRATRCASSRPTRPWSPSWSRRTTSASRAGSSA